LFRTALSKTASCLALVAALAGCKTVGPDFERPAAPTTSGYIAPTDASVRSQQAALGEQVAADWWRYFGSPELDQVMRRALADNPSIQAAEATLAALQVQIRATKAGSAPQVTLNASVEGQRLNLNSFGFDTASFPDLNPNPSFVLYSVGPAVSYAVSPWGQNKRAVEGATARAEAQAHQIDAAYLSITGNIAVQAARIAAIRAEMDVVEAIVADDERLIDLARKAEAAGAQAQGPQVDAQALLAADQARLPPLRQDLAAARHALSVLVGKAPADWQAPDFDMARLTLPQRLPVALPSELVRRRPDILVAEAQLHAATAQIGVATAQLYPQLMLTGGITQTGLSPDKLFSTSATVLNLGLALAAPIYDGGRRKAEREVARENARAALASYQATVIAAFGQVADLLTALAHDEDELAAQVKARETAAESLRLANAAWRGGATGVLPVVDAERQLNTARIAEVRAQAQRYVHTAQLFAATGAGLNDAPKPEAAPAA
jgi:NodT family efflux transporter outer membrane factor (OMF) lipoprotein